MAQCQETVVFGAPTRKAWSEVVPDEEWEAIGTYYRAESLSPRRTACRRGRPERATCPCRAPNDHTCPARWLNWVGGLDNPTALVAVELRPPSSVSVRPFSRVRMHTPVAGSATDGAAIWRNSLTAGVGADWISDLISRMNRR